MVQASFSRTKESAGALDGWNPKELSYLSLAVYRHIATLLNQSEAGAPWSRTSTHAKIVFLEKIGAQMGQAMSYRPLTITSPLYRCWGTMRLECMSPWIREWALPEMHAGIPEMGAMDAWHEVLTTLEDTN